MRGGAPRTRCAAPVHEVLLGNLAVRHGFARWNVRCRGPKDEAEGGCSSESTTSLNELLSRRANITIPGVGAASVRRQSLARRKNGLVVHFTCASMPAVTHTLVCPEVAPESSDFARECTGEPMAGDVSHHDAPVHMATFRFVGREIICPRARLDDLLQVKPRALRDLARYRLMAIEIEEISRKFPLFLLRRSVITRPPWNRRSGPQQRIEKAPVARKRRGTYGRLPRIGASGQERDDAVLLRRK